MPARKPRTLSVVRLSRSAGCLDWTPAAALQIGAGLLPALLLLWATFSHSASAQAWTQGQGQTYTKLSYSSIATGDRYTFDGRRVDYNESQARTPFQDRSLYLYTEAGVTDDVTLVLNIPVKRLTIRSTAFQYETQALGSVQLGGRYNLDALLDALSSPNQLALNGTVSLPTGYTRNYKPSVGPGQVNLALTVDYGRSIDMLPLYAQVGAGFRYRSGWYGLSRAKSCQPGSDIDCLADQTEDLGDEWVASAEVGATPFQGGMLLQGLAKTIWSVRSPQTSFLASNPVPRRRRSVKVGGGLTLYPARLLGADVLSTLGIGIQAFWTPLGRNTIQSRDLFVGVEYSAAL